MRPSITIAAIMSMLTAAGQAGGFVICEILAGYYKYPVSENLAASIKTLTTMGLQIGAVILAIKYEILKLE